MVVNVNVVEGERKRVQAYEGVVIAKRNRGLNSSFTVRKISSGEGVERTFQTYSPLLASIEVKRRGDVRRAKLYYLRDVRASPRGSAKSSRTRKARRPNEPVPELEPRCCALPRQNGPFAGRFFVALPLAPRCGDRNPFPGAARILLLCILPCGAFSPKIPTA